jgi:hypothetical protein
MEATWYATARIDNGAATATKAADTNQRQVITSISAAFSGAKTKTLLIKEGSTTKITLDVVNSLTLNDISIEFADSAAVSAVLEASGTAGVYGSVLISGYTK